MARGAQPISSSLGWVAGAAAAALVLFLTLGTLAVVALRAEGFGTLSPADWSAIRFTLLQASLSAIASVGLAIPLARALARRRFPGRSILITLLGAPFVLPVIVAVLGLIAVFGRNGVVSAMLGWVGLPPIHIYGLHGVIIAHVFFNLPLATRLILHGWFSIPAERMRLASALSFRPIDTQRHIEWPMLREVVPGALLVVFLICTTSFAVALMLGGGPRATTIELAIYEAFRFDFDLGRAAKLGMIQFGIGFTAALFAYAATRKAVAAPGLDRVFSIQSADRRWLRVQDAALITAAAVFLAGPMVMLVVKGLGDLFTLPKVVFTATIRSFYVALTSTVLTLALALPLAALALSLRRLGGGLVEAIGYLSVAASPLVIGTGLFILVFPFVDPVALALPITALVNALMALPFALRVIVPALAQVEADFQRLCKALSIGGWAKVRLVWLPRLRRPLGFAAALAAALSMGDLGVIALFGDPERPTLPLQIYRGLASYRTDDATASALVLLVCTLAIFWVFDRGGRVNADT